MLVSRVRDAAVAWLGVWGLGLKVWVFGVKHYKESASVPELGVLLPTCQGTKPTSPETLHTNPKNA